ncbi:hypothetical protein ACPF7Z_18730 [Halomonas sp. GXIMD04776]|uniref:hypothetical protein n=1 Tax=Halomonas sp. GXIMD04776 TaxID=3415605 RepID=UPI003CB2F04C
MKTDDARDALKQLAELLSEDQAQTPSQRRYPDQALPLLHDESVQKALVKYLNDGKQVHAILPFGYNPYTQINHTLFIFGENQTTHWEQGVLAIT